MKKNIKTYKMRGFTLVELLAVIVILAIILIIAVPKVMSVIEDAKMATLESSAKMIASQAEKAKVQNTVLGKENTINCEDVVKLNNIDYEKCIIEFDSNNNAKVNIKGKGKFDGLNVCDGDKTSSIASSTSCSVQYGNGSAYIEKLETFNGTSNGLIIDDTVDKNIRYVGSNPSNKVYFNCKELDSVGVSYGEENYNYANSCEIWRIIGVFDIEDGSGKIEKRIKIVRDALPISMSWDSSDSSINNGYGINEWGENKHTDGNTYEGADLMRMLNGYYIGEGDTCTYCNDLNQATCINDCSSSITPLSKTSLSMVEEVLWKRGAQSWIDTMPLSTMYNNERGIQSGKICSATATTSEGLYLCTDTVNRTTDWVGKIGLIYLSDYGFASADASCASDILGENSTCENNNWLHPTSWYWTFSPLANAALATSLWFVLPTYSASTRVAYADGGVRPTLYLASSVQIIGGDGHEVPYKLK